MADENVANAGSTHWAGARAVVPIAGGLSRQEFFGGLLILGCVNGLSSRIIEEVNAVGWPDALLITFDISVIVWISCCAGVALVLRDQSGQANAVDLG